MTARLSATVFAILGAVTACSSDDRNTEQSKAGTAAAVRTALERRALTGDAQAQFEIGRAFDTGTGAPASATHLVTIGPRRSGHSYYFVDNPEPSLDAAKAIQWYRKAAEQGNAEAQAALGTMQFSAEGDYLKERVEWLRKAAVQHHANAQNNLGVVYALGMGVPIDAAEAVEWWRKAAGLRHPGAQCNPGAAYDIGEGVAKDATKAVEWWRRAAEQGFVGAQYNVGRAYYDGEGVPKDAARAVEWWQKAAEQGHADAQVNIAVGYLSGNGVPKDAAKGVEWLRKAAEQGYDLAQYILGDEYSSGRHVPRDAAKAAEWMKKAAEQGHTDAQDWVAWAYQTGEGVAQDRVLAYTWSNLAAAQGNETARRRRGSLTLTAAQRAEAERLSSGWKSGATIVREGTPARSGGPSTATAPEKQGTGTAFVVSRSGHAITNNHVVEGCKEVRAVGRAGIVTVSITDAVNDIALVVVPGAVEASAEIRRYPERLRQGAEIAVFGYPLTPVLSSEGNITPGVVSALTGLGNNTNQIQITAPVQPGSSGSPVLNMKGEVVAVVVQKLSDVAMAQATGQLAQNVNFAVSGQTLKKFLDTHQIDYRSGWYFSFGMKTTADLASEARKWTLGLECWK